MEEAIIGTIIVFTVLIFLMDKKTKLISFIGSSLVKITIGAFLLFAVNIVGSFFSIHIPINIVTVMVSGILSVPGIAGLIIVEQWIL